MAASESRIRGFWSWFESVADQLGRSDVPKDLIRRLDERILSFGDVGWQLGPAFRGEGCSFVISPQRSSAHVCLCDKIVSKAPALPGWEFYSARPPRSPLGRTIELDLESGLVEVDFSRWEYRLRRYGDGKVEVEIRTNESLSLSLDAQSAAATLVVEGAVGELTLMQAIAGIDLVEQFEEGRGANAIPVGLMREHFESLGILVLP